MILLSNTAANFNAKALHSTTSVQCQNLDTSEGPKLT